MATLYAWHLASALAGLYGYIICLAFGQCIYMHVSHHMYDFFHLYL